LSGQNQPNLFHLKVKIQFTISTPPASSPLLKGRTEEGFLQLKVYDVLGNEVVLLVNEEKPAGSYEVKFNVGANRRFALISGIYFY